MDFTTFSAFNFSTKLSFKSLLHYTYFKIEKIKKIDLGNIYCSIVSHRNLRLLQAVEH